MAASLHEVRESKDLKRKAEVEHIETPTPTTDHEEITREILESGPLGGETFSFQEFLNEASMDLTYLEEDRAVCVPGNKRRDIKCADKVTNDNLLFCREVLAMGERQRAWKRPTSVEILDRILAELKRDHNVLGFYNFSGSSQNGHHDMRKYIENDPSLRGLQGYVFTPRNFDAYHPRIDRLWFSFASCGNKSDRAIAKTLVKVCKKHGLKFEWNGDEFTNVAVVIGTFLCPIPQSFLDEAQEYINMHTAPGLK